MEGCVKVWQCQMHNLHRGSLCAARYTPTETVVDASSMYIYYGGAILMLHESIHSVFWRTKSPNALTARTDNK